MDNCQKETERSVYLHLFNDYLLLSLLKEWVNNNIWIIPVCFILIPRIRALLSSLQPYRCLSFRHLISLLCFGCFQRGKVYRNRPLSRIRRACRELWLQTSLPSEEPVPAAHDAQIAGAADRHTVRGRGRSTERLHVICHVGKWKECTLFAFFRSDKLRWMSALSRKNPEIDFLGVKGKVCYFVGSISNFTHSLNNTQRVTLLWIVNSD